MRTWRDSQLAELRLRQSELEQRRRNTVTDYDYVVRSQADLREQLSAYKESASALKAAPICSLNEYRSTMYGIQQSERAIEHNNVRLEQLDQQIRELKSSIDATLEGLRKIESEIATYGKVLEFRQ